MKIDQLIDGALEAPIFTSFTRIGYAARRRIAHWTPLDTYNASGKVMVLTGGTSGIGRAAANALAASGTTLILVGRSSERNQVIVNELVASSGNSAIHQIPADMGELTQVRSLAVQLRSDYDHIDVVMHNAGALTAKRGVTQEGLEQTIASQVVGPFLLTSLLLPPLAAAAPSRVITMSSGGMYSAPLKVNRLEMSPEHYNGTKQYALAKRAQVSLNEEWASRFGHLGIHFHAMHPGWVDTPGVDASLPTFSKIMGPMLRTPAQGADTLVWLACDPHALESNGGFWLDRRERSLHKLRSTRRSDTPERRHQLWDWVATKAEIDPLLSVPEN